jgi:hypothetical protein
LIVWRGQLNADTLGEQNPWFPGVAMTTSLDPSTAESIAEFVAREVAGGFTPIDEIVVGATELVSGEAPPETVRLHAETCLHEALEKHRIAQRAWPDRTDCDRLDDAFAKLDARGIVARQNFTCCQNCGHAEIWGEIEQRAPTLPPARGYAFYHWQDTESAVDGHGVFLAYGATAEGEVHGMSIGREIVEVLRAEGLNASWDGSLKARILVALEWRRRR